MPLRYRLFAYTSIVLLLFVVLAQVVGSQTNGYAKAGGEQFAIATPGAGTGGGSTMLVSMQVVPSAITGTFDAYFWYAHFNAIETSTTADQYSDGVVSMLVEDRRGTDAAWEVQFTMGDFIGQDTGEILPAAGVVNRSASIFDYHSGFTRPDYYDPALQSFDVSTGVWSATGNQTGSYYTNWTGMLTVPANTMPGSYTSTLTLDVVSAP